MNKKILALALAVIIVIIFIYASINILSGYMQKINCVNSNGRWLDEIGCCPAECVAQMEEWEDCIVSGGDCVPPSEYCISSCMVT